VRGLQGKQRALRKERACHATGGKASRQRLLPAYSLSEWFSSFSIPTAPLLLRIYLVEIARLRTCQGFHSHWRPIGGAIGGVIGGAGGVYDG
jgi:hypothetical protein